MIAELLDLSPLLGSSWNYGSLSITPRFAALSLNYRFSFNSDFTDHPLAMCGELFPSML
jgi:hypothetical protein